MRDSGVKNGILYYCMVILSWNDIPWRVVALLACKSSSGTLQFCEVKYNSFDCIFLKFELNFILPQTVSRIKTKLALKSKFYIKDNGRFYECD